MPHLPDSPTSSARLCFVVLHHTGVDPPHYDLLIDDDPGSLLLTWRLPTWPVAAPVPATPLPPHRRLYLTYEGPVGGARGEVTRVAAGDCQRLSPAEVPSVAALVAPRPMVADPPSPPIAYRLLIGDARRILLVPSPRRAGWEAIPEA